LNQRIGHQATSGNAAPTRSLQFRIYSKVEQNICFGKWNINWFFISCLLLDQSVVL